MIRRAAVGALVALLLLVHLLIGPVVKQIGWTSAGAVLWFGWVPMELGLRLVWMAAAAGFLAWWIRAVPQGRAE